MNSYLWISALIIMNLLWAGSYTVMKLATGSLHPLAVVFWRMCLSAGIILLWCFIRGHSWKIDGRDLARMIAVGILSATAHLLVMWGVSLSRATDASVLYVIEPTWGIILATIVLRERFSRGMAMSALLVIAGIVVMTVISHETRGSWAVRMALIGNLIIVAGLLCEGSFSVVIKPVVHRYPAAITLAVILITCVAALIIPAWIIVPRFVPSGAGEWMQVAYLAVFCSVVGYLGWIVIMRHVPVNVMYFSIFIQPISGPAIAWACLGEYISRGTIIAGVFLIAGLSVAMVSHLTQRQSTYSDGDSLIVDPV